MEKSIKNPFSGELVTSGDPIGLERKLIMNMKNTTGDKVFTIEEVKAYVKTGKWKGTTKSVKK